MDKAHTLKYFKNLFTTRKYFEKQIEVVIDEPEAVEIAKGVFLTFLID